MNIKENDNLPNSEVFIIEDGEPVKKKIEDIFPQETKKFKNSPDFNHGFNSGCLASFRFILNLIVEDPTGDNKYDYLKNKLDELKEFPKLST